MKCQHCGAEINDGSKFCTYCGSKISGEMIQSGNGTKNKKKRLWLWVLGWIFVFPVPLTIILLRKKNAKGAWKYGAIAVAWIAYLIIGLSGLSDSDVTDEGDVAARDRAVTSQEQTQPESREIARNVEDAFEETSETEEISRNIDYQEQNSVENTASEDVELDKAEQESLEKEKAEKAEQERLAKEKAEKEEQERLAKEKAEKEEQEQLAKEKAEKEEQERLAKEKAEKERAEREKADQERLAKEKAEQDALAASKQSGGNTSSAGGNSNFNTYNNEDQQKTEAKWVLNLKTKKIHYPSCNDVKKISPENYGTSNETLEDLLNQNYSTCGHCFK